ncbi:MAG: redox-sensing transcriptional repressor Rex, partial [Candidatus Omnitrophica bacterium]|nr:redox-sensing transcriptional repressor Rex [Candidatus Omnitrophota bacterium]
CRMYGHLNRLQEQGLSAVTSRDLAAAAGATHDTVRKDLSLLGVSGFTRSGYQVGPLKDTLGKKLRLTQTRQAVLVGLGRLGTALLDYERFGQNGYEIVAGFDSSINKIERIRSSVDIFPVRRLGEVVRERSIELGIIAVPGPAAQGIADELVAAGVKGILNFSSVVVQTPGRIVHVDIDFTNALRFIAARLAG